jgi:hypothetical protein
MSTMTIDALNDALGIVQDPEETNTPVIQAGGSGFCDTQPGCTTILSCGYTINCGCYSTYCCSSGSC